MNFVDDQAGRVLQALVESGLDARTLVIFCSDHGDNQGVRGIWNKSTLYREATSIPMIIAGPGAPSGRVRTTNVNLVDLAPTVLDAAGLQAPADWPGRSLMHIANHADDPMRVGFSEYHAVGSPSAAYLVRQGRWAYHHYVGYEPELFDEETDPGQAVNLAAEPAQASVVAHMESLLRARLDPVAVDLRAKRDQNALIARLGGRVAALGLGPVGATPVPSR